MNKTNLKSIKFKLLLNMIQKDESKSSSFDGYILHASFAVLFSTIISLFLFINSPNGILSGLIVLLFYIFVMTSTIFMLQQNVIYSVELKSKLLNFDHLTAELKEQHPVFTNYFTEVMQATIFDNNQLTSIIKNIKNSVSEEEFKSAIYSKDVVDVKNKYGVGSLFYICHLIDKLCNNSENNDIVEEEKNDIQNKYMMDKFNSLNYYSANIKLNDENQINEDLIKEISTPNLEYYKINTQIINGKVLLSCSFESRTYEDGLSKLLEDLGKSARLFNKMSVVN